MDKAENRLFTDTLVLSSKGMLNVKFEMVLTSRGRQEDGIRNAQ